MPGKPFPQPRNLLFAFAEFQSRTLTFAAWIKKPTQTLPKGELRTKPGCRTELQQYKSATQGTVIRIINAGDKPYNQQLKTS